MHKVIYIPVSHADVITKENLDSTDAPRMYGDDLDSNFVTSLSGHNPNDYIGIRILSNFEIKALTEGRRSKEVQHVDAIVLDVHGGGFMFGSTKIQLKCTPNYAKYTGIPIFSVEYRLAPEHKFPAGLNDTWQAYLWLIKYSEKYLNLKFDKIIIEGESAGGNLALGV